MTHCDTPGPQGIPSCLLCGCQATQDHVGKKPRIERVGPACSTGAMLLPPFVEKLKVLATKMRQNAFTIMASARCPICPACNSQTCLCQRLRMFKHAAKSGICSCESDSDTHRDAERERCVSSSPLNSSYSIIQIKQQIKHYFLIKGRERI